MIPHGSTPNARRASPNAATRIGLSAKGFGIHGTDKPSVNAHQIDWTWGCISLQNPDIEDLVTLVPVGTLVLIED